MIDAILNKAVIVYACLQSTLSLSSYAAVCVVVYVYRLWEHLQREHLQREQQNHLQRWE